MASRILVRPRWALLAALLLLGPLQAAAPQAQAPLPAEVRQALDAIRPHAVRAHVRFLADDLLEGRAAGQRGSQVAALYLAAQLEALGIEPAGDDGSYFQQVRGTRVSGVVPNVVGEIRGRDPALRDEVVVYTAHFDHLGVRTPEGGEPQIFNGAWDNAAGTSKVLEIARGFASLEGGPRRTVLFLFCNAEERGLIGARYYARNPRYPLEDTVANINLDMTEILGVGTQFVALGAQYSTLRQSAEAIAPLLGLEVAEPRPDQLGLYRRSDQFAFVEGGVPAVVMLPSHEHEGRTPEESRRRVNEKWQTIYHKASDEFDPTWHWEGMAKFAQSAFLFGWHVANRDDAPRWNPDSPYQRGG